MSAINPNASVELLIDSEFYGQMQYCGDTLVWNLPSMVGQPGVSVSGFVADPTGQYLIQQPQYVALNAGTPAWTPLTDDKALYASNTDPATGELYLYQRNGGVGIVSDTVLTTAHAQDAAGGFRLVLWRGSAPTTVTNLGPATYNMYVDLSHDGGAGVPLLRVAIEAGNPIRLDVTQDNGATWTVADTSALGESEAYLATCGRTLTIEVLPLTDASYWASIAASASISGPPPDTVCVTINGVAVMTYQQNQAPFVAGKVRVHGLGGQWSCQVFQGYYAQAASMTLPPLTGLRQFQSQPTGFIRGYFPFQYIPDAYAITPVTVSGDQIHCGAQLNVQAPPADIVSGLATATLILSNVDVEFPPVYVGRTYGSAEFTFDQSNIADLDCTHTFDQANFLRRTTAGVTIVDNANRFSPISGMAIGVRAAVVSMGLTVSDTDYNDIQPVLTGISCTDDPSRGFRWWKQNKKSYLRLEFSDRIRGNAICGRMRPLDGQCFVGYAARQLFYKMGIGDQWMTNLPNCGRDSDCPHYHLPHGTEAQPLFQPDPSDLALSYLLLLRQLAGEVDQNTGVVCPYYIYMDSLGNVQVQAAPVGLVQTWLNNSNLAMQWPPTGLVYDRIYSIVGNLSNGADGLGQFVDDIASSANLSNIRTVVVNEGINPFDGSFVVGAYQNPYLGTGPQSSPNVPGYVGLEMMVLNISRYFTTPEAAFVATQVAAVQSSFPVLNVDFGANLQAGLFPLQSIVAVQDFGTMGTTEPVGFYPTTVSHRYWVNDLAIGQKTTVSARLIGQAG